jgi:CopG family nickel-responsive transcriptional regulator
MSKSQIVSVSLEDELLARFDGWVAARGFPSRSGGVARLIRDELDALALADDDTECVATVSYTYDHHQRELLERLAHLQHEYVGLVVSTTHVHVDHSRCLEVLILRGRARQVRELGQRVIAVRGVERGELFLSQVLAPGHDHDHDHIHAHEHGHPAPHRHDAPRRKARPKGKAKPRRR